MRTALTIAGSDPSGGAGIQADLKTFAALGVYGTSVVTAVTVQNTLGVTGVHSLAPEIVAAQIDAVAADFHVAATKIGMLATRDVVRAVVEAIERHRLAPVVIDPVITATTGATLLDPDAFAVFRDALVPLATVLTPNLAEASALTGLRVASVEDMRLAAQALGAMGAAAVVVTGGHLNGPAIDVLFDGRHCHELHADRIDSPHTHGSGCTFASAIAARLAQGDDVAHAVRAAKTYVTRAIEQAPRLGRGHGPLQHFPA